MFWYPRKPNKESYMDCVVVCWDSDCGVYEILKSEMGDGSFKYGIYIIYNKQTPKLARITQQSYTSFRKAANACVKHETKLFLEAL